MISFVKCSSDKFLFHFLILIKKIKANNAGISKQAKNNKYSLCSNLYIGQTSVYSVTQYQLQ